MNRHPNKEQLFSNISFFGIESKHGFRRCTIFDVVFLACAFKYQHWCNLTDALTQSIPTGRAPLSTLEAEDTFTYISVQELLPLMHSRKACFIESEESGGN
jgi:hypothetical protein